MADWIYTKDRMPEDDGMVMVFIPTLDRESPLITQAWYDPEYKFGWSLLPEVLIKAIVAWLPFPEPPEDY